MRINVDVQLEGETNLITQTALIDTGAEISIMPSSMARNIGVWSTNQQTNAVGVFGQGRTLPIIVADIHFPSLKNVGAQFPFAMSDVEQELIVGMDILTPLGVIVNTQTGQLSIKNETWEAFKILTAIGIIVWGGIKVVKKLSEQNQSDNS